MSHEIGKKDTSLHLREAPWHGLGKINLNPDKNYNGREFCEEAELTWVVGEQKLLTRDPEDKKLYRVDSHKLIVREDTGDHLGVVKKSWFPLQNIDFFEFFDPFVKHGMEFETGGSLKNGRLVWVLMKMGGFEIAGDEVRQYFTGLNSHDGSHALWLLPTNVRVVCWNTFSGALMEGKRGLRQGKGFMAKHTLNMKDKMQEFQRAMIFFKEERDRLKQEAERLLKVKMSAERYKGLVDALLPFPEGHDITDRMKNNVKEKRSKMWTAVKHEDLENIRKTGWGAYQAVSDYVSHVGRNTKKSREARFLNVVTGHELLTKTRQIVLAHN